jgi:hypothetical protein
MALSRIIGILWVLAVSVFVRGWVSTHTVATTWTIVVLGILYAVVCVLEWLGVIGFALHAPARRQRAAPPADPVV